MVQRIVTRDSDILKHVLREDGVVKNQQTIQNFDAAMGMIREWDSMKVVAGRERASFFGIQARWKVRTDATDEELRLGYRLVEDDANDDWAT